MFKPILTVLGSMTVAAAVMAACESKEPPKHPEPMPSVTADTSAPSDLPASTTTASRLPADPTTVGSASAGAPPGTAPVSSAKKLDGSLVSPTALS